MDFGIPKILGGLKRILGFMNPKVPPV